MTREAVFEDSKPAPGDVILFECDGDGGKSYIVGNDDSDEVRVYDAEAGAVMGPMLMGSVAAHMSMANWREYEGSDLAQAHVLAEMMKVAKGKGE